MKYFNALLIALLVIGGLSDVKAQNEQNPWLVGFGINAVDFYPTNTPGNGAWFSDFFNYDDHWNVIPTISTISGFRYLGEGFSIGLTGSLNKIRKIGDQEVSDLSYLGLDLGIKYNIMEAFGNKSSWFDPYAHVGGGYTWVNWTGSGTLNGGLGSNFWFNENLGISIQTAYKHSFEKSLTSHFQHTLGIVIRFGGVDTDGDGINDKDDECPTEAGLPEFNGCPDSDGDGIQDDKDACPNEAGLAEFSGCPDSDGDGVADRNDACPDVKGDKNLRGCPDSDGDGIIDKDDACPNEQGLESNNGCPEKDSDNDGTPDARDNCPNEAGPASNNGCPESNNDDQIQLQLNSLNIRFDSESTDFKPEFLANLDIIADIMRKYPNANFRLEGHADSRGTVPYNQDLSDRRAFVVKEYLISKGVGRNKLTTVGFGETQPIADNKTKEGRALNRRVEVILLK